MEEKEKMKISVHGNKKSEGYILATALMFFIISTILMLSFYSLTNTRYKTALKKYKAFYEQLEKNNSSVKGSENETY